MAVIYGVGAMVIDGLGKKGALEQEIQMRDYQIEFKNKIIESMRKDEDNANKEVAKIKEKRRDMISEANTLMSEASVKTDEEIQKCPAICSR